MAVRELLVVTNLFIEALKLAEKNDSSTENHPSYRVSGQVCTTLLQVLYYALMFHDFTLVRRRQGDATVSIGHNV